MAQTFMAILSFFNQRTFDSCDESFALTPTLSQWERARIRGKEYECAAVLMRHAQLLAADLAGEDFLAFAVFHDGGAIDKDGFHARRMAAHFVRVDHVGQ